MSVEKVELVNIVGKKEDVNRFSKEIYLFNNIELINAMTEVDAGRFTLPVTEQNLNELLGFAQIRPGSFNKKEHQELFTLKDRLEKNYKEYLSYDPEDVTNSSLKNEDILKLEKEFIQKLDEKSNELDFKEKQLDETIKSIKAYSYLKNIDIPMRDFNDLKHFVYSIGSLTKDNAERLRLVYPSIPSALFHIGDIDNIEEVFLVISALDFQKETDRVLKALSFKPVEGYDPAYQGKPTQIINLLEEKKEALEHEIEVLKAVQNGYLKKSSNEAKQLYNLLIVLLDIAEMRNYLAFSDNNFFFSGWLPVRAKAEFEEILKGFDDLRVVYNKPGSSLTPPTKLLNNWLFRPFEQLVAMYGMPNYLELDPTPFLSITYILCFGYMFGDVGQGLVLLLGGLYFERKGNWLGAIAARIACASIVFGFLYGSIFGNETILPTLWLKPMDQTTTLLLTSVVMGVVMLIIAYIYSLINKKREGLTEEEYFGKNGLSGFIVYILILVVGLMLYHYLPGDIAIEDVLIGIIILLTLFVFLALPLTNLIKHRRFNRDVNGEYYVTSFFEVFEMYLSMFSNTVSFIRVGAFALTHVGMFMAFETIAEMAGGGIYGIIILIIGNIFIICLEGLIDCIQCLRLEFYELFGKYYQGDGKAFISVQDEIKLKNSSY